MVKYPNGLEANFPVKKEQATKRLSFSDRGMTLEEQINESNEYYLEKQIAVVHKKPTPVQIVKVDYPKRSKAVIREAYFRQASTTDYNGVYRGYYLDFEAKETRNKRSFPLKNFHEHQIVHLENCLKQQGICFTLIKFTTFDRYFVYPASQLITYYRNPKLKSIPLTEIENSGIEISCGYRPTLPYLDAVDSLIKDRKK
ncbi:MAG: Holliday junction resolvase RecU [Lactobacillus sp.]|nr:Holliday junction resolvase RecU [Lactobacillus sp.]